MKNSEVKSLKIKQACACRESEGRRLHLTQKIIKRLMQGRTGHTGLRYGIAYGSKTVVIDGTA